jgi:hypothetical protein
MNYTTVGVDIAKNVFHNWLRVFRDGRICLSATARLGF